MEVSVMGTCQGNICRGELFGCKKVRKLFDPSRRSFPNNKVSFLERRNGTGTRWKESGVRLSLNAVQTDPVVRSRNFPGRGVARSLNSLGSVRLFVGLPLDAVSNCNTINHIRAIAAGLKALKLLGVEGVELPVWWGIAEKQEMGKYDWSGYIALAEMVQNAGLKLHVSLGFHACRQPKIPLPEWVSRIGGSRPDIFYMDRSGQHYCDCLSLAVDDLPLFNGKTPVQIYQEFCASFRSSFSSFMGSTITGITMGLGPDGELRFPSNHRLAKSNNTFGVGEFQCYDKNMLNLLKQHAEATGNPLWGLGGPHDAPTYDQLPNSNNFFKDHGGSWESAYGDFFLSWYSSELMSHGDRLLSIASNAFSEHSVATYGRIPLPYSWYKTRSHPCELTAGIYNTEKRCGYQAIAEMFARNSCKMILPGMDLVDEHQPQDSLSSPEKLLAQIISACRKHGVEIAGQNSSITSASQGFEQIKKHISGDNGINLFTYQRMGAEFFSPEHFPSFTNFVRSLNQPEMHSDDLPQEKEAEAKSQSSIQMQAA